MLKQRIELSTSDKQLILQSIHAGSRIDGRTNDAFKNIDISLSRTEISSYADVKVGNGSRAIATITCDIVKPFLDRPAEGILQFSVESPLALSSSSSSSSGLYQSTSELNRILENIIKDGNAIDLESLCLIDGEKVWKIACNVRILDIAGGNVTDNMLIAAIAALRAFRKPEVNITSANSEKGVLTSRAVSLYSSDAKEPLQLALNYTPVPVSFGLFEDSGKKGESSSNMILVADMTSEEEEVASGVIFVSIDANDQVCSVHKRGITAVAPSLILQAASSAIRRATVVRDALTTALTDLEDASREQREQRLQRSIFSDPVLQFGTMHKPAVIE